MSGTLCAHVACFTGLGALVVVHATPEYDPSAAMGNARAGAAVSDYLLVGCALREYGVWSREGRGELSVLLCMIHTVVVWRVLWLPARYKRDRFDLSCVATYLPGAPIQTARCSACWPPHTWRQGPVPTINRRSAQASHPNPLPSQHMRATICVVRYTGRSLQSGLFVSIHPCLLDAPCIISAHLNGRGAQATQPQRCRHRSSALCWCRPPPPPTAHTPDGFHRGYLRTKILLPVLDRHTVIIWCII